MDTNAVKELLAATQAAGFDFYERRPGVFQLIIPILHEDGDMVDIYLQDSPKGDGYVRICDFGLALMRLSYTYDVNTPARQRIFDSILINNGVGNDTGNLYLDAPANAIYQSILQFAGCVQKVCNMSYWSRETVRSAFYDDLRSCVTTKLASYSPVPNLSPMGIDLISVDWGLTHRNSQFYLFGVMGNDKAKSAAISLLEFQKARLNYTSLIVHEDMDDLGRREQRHLTRNADKQYPSLADFEETAENDILRFAGALA